MKHLAGAIAVAAGLAGLYFHVEYSGFVVFFGMVICLSDEK